MFEHTRNEHQRLRMGGRFVLALAIVAVLSFAIETAISRMYEAASKDHRTLTHVSALEGDAWALHGVLGAALDGTPKQTVQGALSQINTDISLRFLEISRLGRDETVAPFELELRAFRNTVIDNLQLFLTHGKADAVALYRTTTQRGFDSILASSSKFRASLEQAASARERRGKLFTLAVLLVAGALVVVLYGKLLSQGRRRAASAAHETERQRFQAILERAPDMITIWNKNGEITYDSPSVERLLGWKTSDRVGTLAGSTAHPDDRAVVNAVKQKLLDNPAESQIMTFRLRHADGTYHWIEATATNLCSEEAVRGIVSNYRLIDDRKRNEELREKLMTRLIKAQEEERRQIAADIHDDTVQAMVAVQLRLQSFDRAAASDGRDEAIRNLEETVRLTIIRLRRLMFELRPISIDTSGLAAALRDNLEMMSKEIGISHSLHSSLSTEPPIETRLTLYRVAQEALANVRRHAFARNVCVDVTEQDEGIVVQIVDDGVGFDPGEVRRVGHLGLAAMQDRVSEISGRVDIESASGEGTAVTIWAPVSTGPLLESKVGVA